MAGYLGSTPVPQATQHRESFTATEGQTSFATAGYTPQFLDVFLNGSHLSPADFVATNSSDVVLVVAASADDICDIVSYTPFEVADATFTGTTTTDVSLTTGVLTANGGAVFNEGSADVDFRIESNGNANALVVDGGTDTVMIGTTDTNFNAGADNLIVGTGSGDCGITIYTGSSAGHKGSIFFGDSAAGDAANSQKGQISYEQNNEIMTFLTNNTLTMQMDLNGIVTKPRQPAFMVQPASNQDNIPINATTTVVLGSEIFDIGGNFASNTFTAPVTGKYQLNVKTNFSNVDVTSDYVNVYLVASNRSVVFTFGSGAGDLDTYQTVAFSTLIDMDASDTAHVTINLPNQGAAQMSVNTESKFSGYLVA